jgi:hypothetical protein
MGFLIVRIRFPVVVATVVVATGALTVGRA